MSEVVAKNSVAQLNPEELADRLEPTDPQISPDGKSVLFAVAPRGQKGEQREQTIWLWRRNDEVRPFSAGTANDAQARWSPDGEQIIFTSDRLERGESRLFLIPVNGGEAHVLGDLQGELSDPTWSPDGSAVALLRKEPESSDEKKRKEDRDDPVVARADLKPNRLYLVDVASGSARCLTHGQRQVWAYGWSRDGMKLAILTSESADINTIYDQGELWLVPVTGGIPRHVATFPVLPKDPVFVETDDGPAIAVTANAHRADPSDSIWMVPVVGGDPAKVLSIDKGVVEQIVSVPGAPSQVAMRLVEGVHGGAMTVDVTTKQLRSITPVSLQGKGSVVSPPSLSADGKSVALIWTDGSTPEEVYVGAPSGKAKSVTTFGASFSGRLGPVDSVHWPSTDGLEIEGLLTLPPGHDRNRRLPLIVAIHGGPAWQWGDRVMLSWHDWAQMLASRGYAVLQPNPRGSTGYGSPFQQKLQDDVGGGEAQDLITGAQAMVDRGIADGNRLGIGGWSWGGYLTAWTITQTGIFKADVMGAGLANMISDHGQNDIPAMNHWIYPGDPYEHFEHYWESTVTPHQAGDDAHADRSRRRG